MAQDKAGESILRELVEYAQGQLSDEGIRGDIYLFKNNTDSTGNSYGCHENYCIERIDDLTRLEQVFIPYLISRQIFTGAGKVVTNAKGTAYSMSQRAEHIWEAISSATTRSRPIINTRDEPHADPEKYRRLHVIVGDSNMSEFATYLKLGTAAVVLAMIEDRNTVLRDYNMASPINALRDISYDLWSKEPVKLTNGRDLTALEIQDDLCERAELFLQGHPLPADQVHAVTLWREVIEQYRNDPMGLADRVDWIAKLQIIERERERSGVELSDPKIALIDLLVPRHQFRTRSLLPPSSPRSPAADGERRGDRHGHAHATADHASPHARHVHQGGQGVATRLHRRLGAPETQRRDAAHGVVEGPVQEHRRAIPEAAALFRAPRLTATKLVKCLK